MLKFRKDNVFKEKGNTILDWFKVWLSDKREDEEADRDETTEEALTHLIRTLSVEMKKCRRQVGIVLKSEEKLQLQVNKHRNIITKLQVELIKAAGHNNDRHALELIRKRKRYDQTVQQLEQQLAKHSSISDTIQETVRRIELKVEEARRKKLLLATQKQAYETSRKLSTGLEGYGGDNILDAIEDDLTFLQAETRLSLDIDVDRIGVEELERRLEEHATEQHTEVPDEEELANLKQLINDERETLEALPESTSPNQVIVITDDDTSSPSTTPASEATTTVATEPDTKPEPAPPTEPDTKPEPTPPIETDTKPEPAPPIETDTKPEPLMSEEDRELALLKKELALKQAELNNMEEPIDKKAPHHLDPQETIMIIDDDEDTKHREAQTPDILFITDD